jgi:hypothetical protein
MHKLGEEVRSTGTDVERMWIGIPRRGKRLALPALAKLPLPKHVWLSSRQSLASHIDRVVMVRGVILIAAAVLFAAALVLARASPLFS